jgi:hypothetical protein
MEWVVSGRGRKRDREEQISTERGRALESFGNDVGCKFDCWD